MIENPCQKLALSLELLLNRLHKYFTNIIEKGQPFGACLVNPRHSQARKPTPEIQKQIEQFATNHFSGINAIGYYLRYSTLPITPIDPRKSVNDESSIDDYVITLEHPQFDDRWQQTTISRALLFCMHDHEDHAWDEWFEPQTEAIRLTPLLHQTINESIILNRIQFQLSAPVLSFFENFVYEYALTDSHIALSRTQKELLRKKETTWQDLYPQAVNTLKPVMSLINGYKLVHKKAASTRNPILKSLWWEFIKWIDNKLINHTTLSDDMKCDLINQLRNPKKKALRSSYQAKRPALSISDVECAQVLYILISEFINSKTKKPIPAEAIIFIWIAQHTAFSGLHLSVSDIISLQIKNLCLENHIVKIGDSEVDISTGLKEIIQAYIQGKKRKEFLFQSLTHDNLEDVLSRASRKLYGEEGKLLPKDFLERVHVISGLRISIEARRLIDKQAELIKNSPYRIKSSEIKKDIKQAIRDRKAHI